MLINHFFKSNESFSYEALRAAGYSNYGGADLGEVIAICSKIRPGNEEDWVREWQNAAERAFYRRENVDEDKLSQFLYESSENAFVKAMEVSEFRYEPISIPYEGTSLPGYFIRSDRADKPRRTIIFNGGFDSTSSEGWFAIGAAALARGYNFLAFDGPGQGAAIRRQGMHFRHDWENVLTPIMNYALSRAEINANGIVLFGWSMGGYLVARAATQEHRAAAIVLDDGVYDFGSAFRNAQPLFIRKLVEWNYDTLPNLIFDCVSVFSTGTRWALRNGKWTFGVDSAAELSRATSKYTLEGISHDIVTPCLIVDAENDHFLKGQPELLRSNLSCECELLSLGAEEGGDTHCHQGAFFRLHQVVFDFLESRLEPQRIL
ncbi:alpha/beta-hydrolase [Aspergillus falconensis]